MRILSLTAGAASMYCGSCLRDNALAARLIKLGHDDPQPICQTGAPSIAHLDIMMP